MHAVELRSCHVYAAHDQRRTHVALIPLRGGVTVLSCKLRAQDPAPGSGPRPFLRSGASGLLPGTSQAGLFRSTRTRSPALPRPTSSAPPSPQRPLPRDV